LVQHYFLLLYSIWLLSQMPSKEMGIRSLLFLTGLSLGVTR
jgi:hypothetical protein